MSHKKTFFYLFLIIVVTITIMNLKSLDEFKSDYTLISESAEPIYSGKIKAVYNPLDNGYIISEELKTRISSESRNNFLNYKNWQVLSLQIDPKDLYDQERGIIANAKKKGRLWERASHLTFYQSGKKTFESMVGLRIHGGSSRKAGKKKSFRIYFRNEYGKKHFNIKPNFSLSGKGKLKRIVVRTYKNLYFADDFGFDIHRKLGGLAPKTIPTIVYINNKIYGHFFLAEHLDEQQLINNFQESYHFFKLKGNNKTTPNLLYEALRDRLYEFPAPLDINYVKNHVNLDHVIAHFITVLYTGMTDWHQGTMFKKSEEGSVWNWIAWDYDNAFIIDRPRIAGPEIKERWQIPSIRTALELHQGNVRALIFSRFIKEENEEFQKILFKKINFLFNEILTKVFIKNQLTVFSRYALDAKSKKMKEDIKQLENFIKYRKDVLCSQIQNALKAMPSTCYKK